MRYGRSVRRVRQFWTLLKPFGLPARLRAAVLVYPAGPGRPHRRESSAEKRRSASFGRRLTAWCNWVAFPFLPNWQPGEALAVQQSEALRKMLLGRRVRCALVVLVRFAEQLYRLRPGKASAAGRSKGPSPLKPAKSMRHWRIASASGSSNGNWKIFRFATWRSETYNRIAKSLNEKRARA